MAIYRIKRFNRQERTDYDKMKDFIIGATEGQVAIELGKKILKDRVSTGRSAALKGVAGMAVGLDALRRAHKLTRKHNPDY